MRRLALALLCALAFASIAVAIDQERAFDDPALQGRYERLGRELRCLVCQNQTIADSNAGLAVDLRRELREQIAAGRSDEEIKRFMTDRYGDFVLYNPPVKPTTWLLWAAPVLLLALALGSAAAVIRRRARAFGSGEAEPKSEADPT